MKEQKSNRGATKRFKRRLCLSLIIIMLLIVGALVIAYSAGSDRGEQLYKEALETSLLDAYNQGIEHGQAEITSVIESGELTGFGLEGDEFIVYITFNGKTHDYHCSAGDVVEALPFQQRN